MTILISLLLLLYGGIVLWLPKSTRQGERQLLRCLHIISHDRCYRPVTKRQLHFQRAIGLVMIMYSVPDLLYLGIGLEPTAIAATLTANANHPGETNIEERVTTAAKRFMADHKPVGLSIGVVNKNTSFTIGLGETAIGNGMRPGQYTIFEIGSITKTFTGTVLSHFVRCGELALDQPLSSLLPPDQRVPSFEGESVTLKNLSTHTSGLPRLPTSMMFKLLVPGYVRNPYASYSPADLYAFLRNYSLSAKPGTRWEYSNLGAGILGFALARHTSSTCEAMFDTYICKPLGMKDTAIKLSTTQKNRLAIGYSERLSFGRIQLHQQAENWGFQDTLAGGGALKSSVHDMVCYLEANITLAPPLGPICKLAQQVHYADNGTTMGLGWVHADVKGVGPVICHDGGTGGYSSFLAFDRNGGGVIILCNSAGAALGELGVEILKILTDGPERKPSSIQSTGRRGG